MAAPSLSVPGFLQALGKVKELWDAFYGEFSNAPYRIQELNDAFNFLESAFITCHELCQTQGFELPTSLVRPLVGKLSECKKFIHRYQRLANERELQTSQGGRVLQQGLQVFDIIRYTFDGDAAKLKTDLTSETIKLSNFTNMLQLGLLVSVIRPRNDSNTLTSTAPSPESSMAPTPQTNLTASDAAEFLDLYPDLRNSVTVVPTQGSHRSRWTFRIGLHRRPRLKNQSAALPFFPAPIPSNAHNIPLVSTESFYCSVNAIIDAKSIPLQSYLIRQSDSGPVVEWRGIDNAISISHYLGPETIPLTAHSAQRKPRHQVHFHFPHRILLWNGSSLVDRSVYIKYHFVAQEPTKRRSEFESFQGRLCGRELIGGRFEFNVIRSRRSTRRSTEARNQHLKIWKSNTEPPNYVLSFYVGKKSGNSVHLHQEYPMRWLERTCYEMDPKEMQYTVQLRFVDSLGVLHSTATPRGSISWSPNFSFSMSSSIGSSMTSTGTLSSPPDYGFGGLETLSGLPPSADHAERYAPQDIIREIGFLLITFTSDTDIDNFKVAFDKAHTSMEPA